MKTTTKLQMASWTLAAVVAGTALFGQVRSCQRREDAEDAHRARVAQVVERFKACPDRQRIVRGCLENEEAVLLQAKEDRDSGKFEDAGVLFARLGMEDDALGMAGRCALAGDDRGRSRILEELKVMQDALEEHGIPPEEKAGVELGDAGSRDARHEEDDAGIAEEHDVYEEDAGAEDAEPDAAEEAGPDVAVEEEAADAGIDALAEEDSASDTAEEAEAEARRRRDARQRRDARSREAVTAEAASQRDAGGRRDASAADTGRTIIF